MCAHIHTGLAASSTGQYVVAAIEADYPATSSDFGETFAFLQTATGTNFYSAAVSMDASVMAVTRRNAFLYVSRTQGADWNATINPGSSPTWAFTQGLAISANGSSMLAAQSGVNSAVNGSLWYTTDYGTCLCAT